MSVEAWAEAWWKKPLEILPAELKREPLRTTRLSVGLPREVRTETFRSLSRNCPYEGMRFTCWPVRA